MQTQDFFGQLPYPPDQKKPKLMRKEDRKVFIFSPEVPQRSNSVEVVVSTDQLHAGMMEMGPGATWHFVDEHLGDEVYFLLSGNLTELECNSGDCRETNAGEMLYIPMGCKHKGYNFSEESQIIFWAIAPDMWPEETDQTFAHKDIRQYKNGKDHYGLKGIDEKDAGLRKSFRMIMRDVNQLGNFPVPGSEAREEPIFYYVMNDQNCLTTVHGLEHPMRLRFFVSNDFMEAGEYYLPAGGVGSRISEVFENEGDTALYGLEGKTTIFLPDDPAYSYIMEVGDIMYLPAKTKYQFINYTAHAVKGYFVNAVPVK